MTDDPSGRTPAEAPRPPASDPPVFAHPRWMVGVVLIFGVAFIIAGFDDPIWFVIGFPCILVLVVWLWVRWSVRA